MLPELTSHVKGEKCYRSKISKDLITLLVGTNVADTDKLSLIAIGDKITEML